EATGERSIGGGKRQREARVLECRTGQRRESAIERGDMRDLTQTFSRRKFLAQTSCFGAYYAVARRIPLQRLNAAVAADSRVAQTPLVDKGFASVRKIGEGLYATISDFSKGPQTICNGGFVIGKDGALLIEGFTTATGAAFQMEALRMVSQ